MTAGQANPMAGVLPRRGEGVGNWRRWVPGAAVAWSLGYAALGVFWAAGGRGFPYTPETANDALGPLIGRFGPGAAWIAVILAGLPAAGMGAAMLRQMRGQALRPILVTAGALLAAVLLLLMTGLTLLVLFGYIPFVVVNLFTSGEVGQKYLADLMRWSVVHQLVCLVGGFLWLAATASYARRSGDACVHCGRRGGAEGWQRPDRAARWGRIAVYISMLAPALYALTRYAWALGFALGMSGQDLTRGQAVSGMFLATFGLAGAVLTLGLVQRWGEVFPRWVIGLAGRRVPVALAVTPAAFVSVLLVVGGVVVWSLLPGMVGRLAARGEAGAGLIWEVGVAVGPVLLFPVWGVALAVAALGYSYRRRGPCRVCGRGASTAALTT